MVPNTGTTNPFHSVSLLILKTSGIDMTVALSENAGSTATQVTARMYQQHLRGYVCLKSVTSFVNLTTPHLPSLLNTMHEFKHSVRVHSKKTGKERSMGNISCSQATLLTAKSLKAANPGSWHLEAH